MKVKVIVTYEYDADPKHYDCDGKDKDEFIEKIYDYDAPSMPDLMSAVIEMTPEQVVMEVEDSREEIK